MILVFVMILSCSGLAAAEKTLSPAQRNAAEDLLLIVDFQNVYLPGYAWACPSMPEAIRNTVSILSGPNAPDYLLTAFIPADQPEGRWKDYNETYQDINTNPFLAEFADQIKPYATDGHIAYKSTYSSMKCDRVLEALKDKKAVVLTGVVAECCVAATMLDAIDLGYEVVYLYDGIAGNSEETEERIQWLAGTFSPIHVTVMSCSEYLEAIS